MRSRGLIVPNVDPNNGGVRARVLFLLRLPARELLEPPSSLRKTPIHPPRIWGRPWNGRASPALKWSYGTSFLFASAQSMNRNVSGAQIWAAVADTQAFMDCLPNLAVTVFCGRSAQRAAGLLQFPSGVRVLSTFHPGAQSFNRPKLREHVLATFAEAYREISS